MKMALSGSDLDIFSCPSLRPASMWCEMMTGLNFFFLLPAYSLSEEHGRSGGGDGEW
jgi:hypothetical protein